MIEKFLTILQDEKSRKTLLAFMNMDKKTQKIFYEIAQMSGKKQEEVKNLAGLINTIGSNESLQYIFENRSPMEHITHVMTAASKLPKIVEELGTVTKKQFVEWVADLPSILISQQGNEKLLVKSPKKNVSFIKSYADVVAARVKITYVKGRTHTSFGEVDIHFTVGNEFTEQTFEHFIKRIHDKVFKYEKVSVRNSITSAIYYLAAERDNLSGSLIKELDGLRTVSKFSHTVEGVYKEIIKYVISLFDTKPSALTIEDYVFDRLKLVGNALGCFYEWDKNQHVFGFKDVGPSLRIAKVNKQYTVFKEDIAYN